ncbi:hypothetical protein H9Q09_01150 [Aurantimonas sp. DM33-3]|nr:hypothetical protein [Aurantimonas sp. DM33-3]
MPAETKKTWYVQREGWVFGQYRKVNDVVKATEDEVKYLVRAGNLGAEKVTATEKRKAASSTPATEASATSETPASKAVADKSKT